MSSRPTRTGRERPGSKFAIFDGRSRGLWYLCLLKLLAAHPDTKDGNIAIAQHLWGYKHWTRVQMLRAFVAFLAAEGLTTHEALKAWAHASDFNRDFEGRAKGLGIAAYQWLGIRLGVDTLKPDTHLHTFVQTVLGHPVTDADLVRSLTEAAKRLKRPARDLDWGIWEQQRGAPGAI